MHGQGSPKSLALNDAQQPEPVSLGGGRPLAAQSLSMDYSLGEKA